MTTVRDFPGTLLTNVVFVLTVSSAYCFASCSKVPVEWPKQLGDCIDTPNTGFLFGLVLETLATGDWRAGLEELAREHGPKTVACLLDEVGSMDGLDGSKRRTDDNRPTRARAFLAEKEIARVE